LSKKELAVGDSTKLEIIFSTKTYKNRITKRPKIQTNEGPPDKRVQIIADVVSRPDSTYPLVMKPYKLDLSQFGEKLRDKIDFTITNVSDAKIDLEMIDFAKDYFEVKLPKSISPGESASCTLKLKKDAVSKNFEKSFTLETNDTKKSRFTMPVKRQLRASAQDTKKVTKASKNQ